MADRIDAILRKKFDRGAYPAMPSMRAELPRVKPVTAPDSKSPVSGRRNSRVRRLDSRGSANK